MFYPPRLAMRPAGYHGAWSGAPFFEGWYFKLVTADQQDAYAVIPGIFKSADSAESHAFVQVLHGNSGEVSIFRYPYEAFQADEDGAFEMRIGENHFNLRQIELCLRAEGISIDGRLKFGETIRWPVRLISPGIMGWFGWLSFMECYHGVLGFDHSISGALNVGGKVIDFSGGRGYIEKDWGKSFPECWIWMQSNHFLTAGTSLSASIAMIPLGKMRFPGMIIGVRHQGQLYAFSTYNGAKLVDLAVSDDSVRMTARRGKLRVVIEARRSLGGLLNAPTPRGMDRRIAESLNAEIHLRLLRDGQMLLDETGRRAGLEVVGEVSQLMPGG
ncbi:MAG: hypothetical protein JW750_01100 [Anaerolineaceae bacterium]|nr:hypothetical protein [Anaerolineaceae bacterium]